MNSITEMDTEMVKRIVRDIADDFSPEESVLVDPLVDDYFADRTTSLSSSGEEGEMPLALAGSSDLILAIVVPLAVEVIKKVIDGFANASPKQPKADAAMAHARRKVPSGTLSVQVNIDGTIIDVNIKLAKHSISPKTATKIIQKLTELAYKELRKKHVI